MPVASPVPPRRQRVAPAAARLPLVYSVMSVAVEDVVAVDRARIVGEAGAGIASMLAWSTSAS